MVELNTSWRKPFIGAVVLIVNILLSMASDDLLSASRQDLVKPLDKRFLELHLRPPQSSFMVGEPIFIEAYIENTGSATEYWTMSEAAYDVIRQDGTKLEPGWDMTVEFVSTPFVEGVGDDEYSALKPHGQSDPWEVEVTKLYGVGCHTQYYLPAGTYQMCARWLKSDTATIRVEDPMNSDDSGAVETITTLLDREANCLDEAERQRAYELIVDTFSASRLLPRALNQLRAINFLKHTEVANRKSQEYAKLLILRFPTHPYAGLAVFKLDLAALKPNEIPQIRDALHQMLSRQWREDYRKQIESSLKSLE